MNKLLVSLILAGLVVSARADVGAKTDTDDVTVESVFASIGDILIVRPIGAAVTLADFGIYGIASPFAAMADATDKVYDTLVVKPGEYTFCRDLGDFSK